MAPKLPHFGTLLVLIATLLSALDTVQSKHPKHKDAFGFIHKLEGCHKTQNVSGLHHLKRYLEHFGYLNYSQNDTVQNHNSHADDDLFDDLLDSAVKSYQRNYNLEVSGTLDAATVKLMSTPRCGVPDIVNDTPPKSNPRKVNNNRKLINSVSRYSFFPGNHRWAKTHLTYRFRSSASAGGVGGAAARSACASAFAKWASVSRFTFSEVAGEGSSDIEIGFHSGDHGDGHPFDGAYGTLAHAFRPSIGRLHFDAAERWSTSPGPTEVDLESVAVHEIGHVLGLGHEPRIPDAIMYPSIDFGMVKRALHQDDIQGIRALYGLN